MNQSQKITALFAVGVGLIVLAVEYNDKVKRQVEADIDEYCAQYRANHLARRTVKTMIRRGEYNTASPEEVQSDFEFFRIAHREGM